MAESSIKAFGRYLRTLRERHGLSLDEVASLSQTFPEKINKGYLSRCENGHQKLAFSKVIALSRIYDLPADVLVERVELDLELDRVGGPETDDLTYAELTDAGKKALQEGFFFNAYGYLRDAIIRAGVDEVRSPYRDLAEQSANAAMNHATSARALGRYRFALHEFLHLDASGQLGDRLHPVLMDRIACCHRSLGNYEASKNCSNAAIEEAEAGNHREYLGYLFSNLAHLELAQSNASVARDHYQTSYRLHRESGQQIECLRTLNNLAQCYFEMKQYAASRRSAAAAEKAARLGNHDRCQALSLIILGELDDMQNRPGLAEKRWKLAAKIARRLDDKVLRFKSDFVRYRKALRVGERDVARAIRRRLVRLSPWLPLDTDELRLFKELNSSSPSSVRQ